MSNAFEAYDRAELELDLNDLEKISEIDDEQDEVDFFLESVKEREEDLDMLM